jgi:hypothetical protein
MASAASLLRAEGQVRCPSLQHPRAAGAVRHTKHRDLTDRGGSPGNNLSGLPPRQRHLPIVASGVSLLVCRLGRYVNAAAALDAGRREGDVIVSFRRFDVPCGPTLSKMATGELPGRAETAVLDALHRGALRTRCSARAIPALRDQPAGEQLLHEILDRCEARGLVRSDRYRDRREWRLTAAGRARLRTRRRYARELAAALTRTG